MCVTACFQRGVHLIVVKADTEELDPDAYESEDEAEIGGADVPDVVHGVDIASPDVDIAGAPIPSRVPVADTLPATPNPPQGQPQPTAQPHATPEESASGGPSQAAVATPLPPIPATPNPPGQATHATSEESGGPSPSSSSKPSEADSSPPSSAKPAGRPSPDLGKDWTLRLGLRISW